MPVDRSVYKGYKNPGGLQLESFRPPKVDLRQAAKSVHKGGIVRPRAAADTKKGLNPKHGYLTAMAQKRGVKHGYLLKQAKAKRSKK